MEEFSKEVGIKLLTSTPNYAHENGLVKSTNKVVIGLIKKNMEKNPKNWRTTLRSNSLCL